MEMRHWPTVPNLRAHRLDPAPFDSPYLYEAPLRFPKSKQTNNKTKQNNNNIKNLSATWREGGWRGPEDPV